MSYQGVKSKSRETLDKFKSSFIYLGQYFFSGPTDLFYVPFAAFHLLIESRFLNSLKRYFVIEIPRGFGKTKLVVLYVLWSCFIRKRNYVIFWSYSQKKSKQSVKDVVRCMEKPLFKKIFGWTRSLPWSDVGTEVTVKRRNGSEFRLVAMGIKQQSVGWSEGADRPDLMVFDDIENPDESPDMELNKRILSRLTVILKGLAARTTAGLMGQALFIGTPHYRGCVIQKVAEWPDADKILFPCLVADTEDMSWEEMSELLGGIPYDHSIWEEMHSTAKLHEERAADLSRGEWPTWMAQMMVSPEAEESLRFDEKYFVEITQDAVNELLSRKEYRIVLTIDMAYTQKTYSDYVGFALSMYLPHFKRVVLEAFKKKIVFDDIYNEILRLRDVYGSFGFKGESDVYAESLQIRMIQDLVAQKNANMLNEDPYFEPIEIHALTDKLLKGKANRIGMTVNRHRVKLWLFTEGKCDQLRIEAKNWTGVAKSASGTDDILDADSWHWILMAPDNRKMEKKKEERKDVFEMGPKEHVELYWKRRQSGKIRNLLRY